MDGNESSSRRRFLVAAAGAPALLRAAKPGESRPNIVLLLTDDQRCDALGCMGNTVIRTPNADRLAAQGVVFENNFTTTSICMASRASILTGLYTRCHGVNDFATSLKPADFDRSYPALLRAAGYRTGFIGKYGVGNAMPAGRFDYWKGFAGQGRFFPEPGGDHLTNTQGEQAVEFIEGSRPGRPFCLSVSFKAPHAQDEDPRQFLYDPALESLYRDVEVPLPKTAAPRYFDRMPEFLRNSEGRNRWKRRFDTPERYQQMVKAYYRLVTGVDIVLGRIRQALADVDCARNTIILFTSDNGCFLGERGMADKWLPYEESIRTPLIVYDPRQPGRGRRRAEMSLNIDLAPTLLDLAGLPVPAGVQGCSLRPLLGAGKPAWRREWFYEHGFDYQGKIPRSEGIRTEQWKYIRYLDPHPEREELYDLGRDPIEEHDLAGEQRLKDKLGQLRGRWRAWSEALARWNPDAQWKDPA
ncbi:MAG TPA: sulfatase [Bryobacteraceae bacterium]|nr:sulfatase [Bryobacteraceae bacterium]